MNFRLVPKSVTLNDLERRTGVILRYFSEFGYLPGALRKSSRSLSYLLMSSCYFRERLCGRGRSLLSSVDYVAADAGGGRRCRSGRSRPYVS